MISLEPNGKTIRVGLRIGDEEDSQNESIEARCVINAAGLYSDEVAAMLGNNSWKIYPVRGEYCEVRGARASLINNLVYPLPHADGLSLGVHFTKTLWGTFLLGPTATYVDRKDNYEKDRLPIAAFAESAKTLVAGNRRSRSAPRIFGAASKAGSASRSRHRRLCHHPRSPGAASHSTRRHRVPRPNRGTGNRKIRRAARRGNIELMGKAETTRQRDERIFSCRHESEIRRAGKDRVPCGSLRQALR